MELNGLVDQEWINNTGHQCKIVVSRLLLHCFLFYCNIYIEPRAAGFCHSVIRLSDALHKRILSKIVHATAAIVNKP